MVRKEGNQKKQKTLSAIEKRTKKTRHTTLKNIDSMLAPKALV